MYEGKFEAFNAEKKKEFRKEKERVQKEHIKGIILLITKLQQLIYSSSSIDGNNNWLCINR